MTILFFLLSLLFGWLAYNLYHPIYRHQVLSAISFLSGWLTGELALHHILWQVLLVTLFVWSGAVEGFLGALGLLICITSWFTMGYFYVQGNEARDEMESALLSGLGADFQGRIHEEFRTHFPLMPDFNAIKRPFARIDPMLEVVKDVPFGHHQQALDIYRSRNSVAGKPVLFQIHGGAWTEKMGSKNESY